MRFFSPGLKTTAGTKPPPSIRTFFQEYGSAAAADAVEGWARATATAPANRANTVEAMAVLLIRYLPSTYVHMGALPEASVPCHVPVKTRKPGVDNGADLRIVAGKLLKNVQQRPEMGRTLTVNRAEAFGPGYRFPGLCMICR